MDRVDFYYKQLVTQAELDQAFQMVADAVGDRAKDVRGGIHWGIEPFEAATPDLTVDISAGVAYTLDTGDRCVVGTVQNVDLSSHVPSTPGDSVWVRVYVKHDTVTSDARTDGLGNPLDYVIEDSFEIGVRAGTPAPSPTKPSWNSDEVSIFMVMLAYGQTVIGQNNLHTDVWAYDRVQGGTAVAPGRRVDYLIKFDKNYFDTGDEMIDFDNGEVVGLHLLTMDGASSEIEDVDQIRFFGSGSFIDGLDELDMVGTASVINTKGGDLQMDDLANGSGGRIFCENGYIYKPRRIQIWEPGTQGGYQYCEAGGAGNEQGNPVNLDKWLQYDPMSFYPGAGSDHYPHLGVAPNNHWQIRAGSTTGKGGVSPNTLLEGWEVDLNWGAGAFYDWGLYVPLLGLPHRCKIVKLDIVVNVITATGDYVKLYGWVVRYDENGNQSYLTPDTPHPSSPLVDNEATGFKRKSLAITANDIIDPSDYYYVLILKTWQNGTLGSPGSYVRVHGVMAHYQIREASGYYG